MPLNSVKKTLRTFATVNIQRLTWEGHEFLDSARNKEAWKHANEVAKKNGGVLSFEVLKTVLTTYIKSKLES
jgi:hypothetical protein